jgi:hypothetical protein
VFLGLSRLHGMGLVAFVVVAVGVGPATSSAPSPRPGAHFGTPAAGRLAVTGSHAADRPVTWATVVADPDEADSTDGPLDVARVSHRLEVAGSRTHVELRLVTHEPFRIGHLHAARRHLVVELDTDGQPGAERNLRISSRQGTAVAELISNATRRVLARLPLVRPDARSVLVSADRDLLGARKYFWTATYHDVESAECGQEGGVPRWCQDTVPDRGWIRMDRPAWPRS